MRTTTMRKKVKEDVAPPVARGRGKAGLEKDGAATAVPLADVRPRNGSVVLNGAAPAPARAGKAGARAASSKPTAPKALPKLAVRAIDSKAAEQGEVGKAASSAAAPKAKVANATRKATTVAAPVAPVRRKRRNRRSEETITNILAATEAIVLESGAERISILDVCKAAQVSRGTFYRYFSSQDELLDAFSRHKRDHFHHALIAATEPFDDPDERFEALIGYLEHYLEHGKARRLLVVAPDYALGFFKRIFHDSIVRFEDVLRPVFDTWDERLGTKVDRELVCEMLIRYVLSEQLVPGSTDRRALPRRVARMVASMMGAGVARTARR